MGRDQQRKPRNELYEVSTYDARTGGGTIHGVFVLLKLGVTGRRGAKFTTITCGAMASRRPRKTRTRS